MNHETVICLTIDCNSEPQAIVDWSSGFVREMGVSATFFLPEGRSDEVVLRDGHEVALMTRIDNVHECREKLGLCMRDHPSAKGVRFFGGLNDFRVTQVVRELGLRFLSTLFLPHHVPPFRQRGLLQFPIIFQDLAWALVDKTPGEDLFEFLFSPARIYTALFHMGLVFHNVGCAKDTTVMHDPTYVPSPSKGHRGMKNVLVEFIDFCRHRGYFLQTVEEASRTLRDLRDLREMNWRQR